MYLSECLFFNPCFSLTFHQMTRTYYSIQDIFFYSLFYGVSHFCDFQLDLRKQHIVKWEQLRLLSLAQIHSLSLSSRWLHLPVWLWTLKTIEMFSTANLTIISWPGPKQISVVFQNWNSECFLMHKIFACAFLFSKLGHPSLELYKIFLCLYLGITGDLYAACIYHVGLERDGKQGKWDRGLGFWCGDIFPPPGAISWHASIATLLHC